MIDSQTQVRWLAAAVALVVFVIGPVTAGMVFRDTRAEVVVFDALSWDTDSVADLTAAMSNSAETVIFQRPAGWECAGANCSSWIDEGNLKEGLRQTEGATTATRADAPAGEPRHFTVFDVRSWDEDRIASLETAVAPQAAIFLVPPDVTNECGSEGDTCPLDSTQVEVPMSLDGTNTVNRLEEVYDELKATPGTTKVTRPGEAFDPKAAWLAGGLLLISALVVVAVLVGRQPRRPVPATGYRDPPPRPIPVVPHDVPTSSPQRSVRPPVLALADLPGAREVVREHGATAKARSHIDGAGGYIALGDVLMWATPLGDGVAYPDDDVHVTVSSGSVTPTLDGGLRP